MIARTRRRTVSLPCLGVLVLIALVPRDTTAQVLYGSVVGDVKDATGGALPGATLVITSTDRGLSREAVTDAGGHFTFSNLPAGVYGLKAHQQGFKGFEQKEVTVTINAVIRVDVTLEVWPDMFHVWHFFAPMLPEGRQAIEEIGTFIRSRIG